MIPKVMILLTLVIMVACSNAPPEAAPPKAERPIAAEFQECRVGDVCIFRPPRKAALGFSNMRAFAKFRRLQEANDPDPYEKFQAFDPGMGWFNGEGPDATGKEHGDLITLPAVTQIRVVKIEKQGTLEAVIVADNYHPSPDGIGWVGVKLAGHKVWLDDVALWVRK
jgi:hypothetical protein